MSYPALDFKSQDDDPFFGDDAPYDEPSTPRHPPETKARWTRGNGVLTLHIAGDKPKASRKDKWKPLPDWERPFIDWGSADQSRDAFINDWTWATTSPLPTKSGFGYLPRIFLRRLGNAIASIAVIEGRYKAGLVR